MTRLNLLALCVLLGAAACADNRGVSRDAAARSDGGTLVESDGSVPPTSGGRRLVVHGQSSPTTLIPPSGQAYLEVELTLINEASAPVADLGPGLFEVQAQAGTRYPSLTPPEGWAPARTACPVEGSIPPDARFHCTALFLVPGDLVPDRVRYSREPVARAILADDPAAEAARLCREAGAAAEDCTSCLAEASTGACATDATSVQTLCPDRSCAGFGRSMDDCTSAVGSFHLCVEEACTACDYVAGVR